MATEIILNAINEQQWLEPLAGSLQKGVHQTFESAGAAGAQAKSALHGTWLGHPVHPAVTDIPVGAWTAAAVYDGIEEMSGTRAYSRAADLAVAVGLGGAAISAVTGLTDWSDTDGRSRKLGLVHGLMNLTSAALYTSSLICRKQGDRSTGRKLAWLGYLITIGASWLGGEMVYSEQVGVNHTAGGAPLPEQFIGVLSDAELGDGERKRVDANGTPVLLYRNGGRIYAIHAVCSHAGGPLEKGDIKDNSVTCPWHGSEFDLRDGSVLNGPATHPQPCFSVRVRDGQIEIRASR